MNIKDIVYGEVEISEKFQHIIDTPEFQRLRRIKQLATANLVFPSANHTRFEHCIGTFHVMQKIVRHFDILSKKLDKNIRFEQGDIDAVLMAALLHDIGHGPFSHAFEHVLGDNFDHEKMTCSIILDKGTEIHKRMLQYFGKGFPEKVVDFINVRNEFKGNVNTGEGTESHNGYSFSHRNSDDISKDLIWIFSRLVSSQLDADRMDYILRDALEAGVPFGGFDVDDLVSGMRTIFSDNQYRVCVLEKYLPHVEGYLYARYQMYRNVYMSSYKIFTEELLCKIIRRIQELYKIRKISLRHVPVVIKCLLNRTVVKIADYCRLDDHVMMGAIADWSINRQDKTLALLSKSFLNRYGFEKVTVLHNYPEEVSSFKRELFSICKKYLKNIPLDRSIGNDWFSSVYFWIENEREFCIYNRNSSKIYIQCSDGSIKELTEISSFIDNKKESQKAYYINFDLLGVFFEENAKNFSPKVEMPYEIFKQEVKKLIESFNIRNQREIETKYVISSSDDTLFSAMIEFLKEIDGTSISEPENICQEDTYFDSMNFMLTNNKKILRMRKKGNAYIVTFKEPVKGHGISDNNGQTIRIEKETITKNDDLKACWVDVTRMIPDISDINPEELQNIIVIKNDRVKYDIFQDDFKVELVFDDVTYFNSDNKEYHEKQVELELKSSYEYRLNLALLTDRLESHFGDRLEKNSQSKLERGLSFLGILGC
ncbi:hypothetical protein AGMMS49928_26600 [Spirochaetia bacterium]|nr:hypothetical protein AGMMS49928_26600 [Spirochaetia bacterium]